MVFSLPEDASDAALELRDALAPLTDGSDPLTLDGGRVNHISTATLQILLVACRTAEQRGIGVRWTSVSAVLHDAAECLGLAAGLHMSGPGSPQKERKDGEYPGG